MKIPQKKILSNSIALLLFAFILAMLISPRFKAKIIAGLMNLGLFQPDVSDVRPQQGIPAGYPIHFSTSDGQHFTNESFRNKVVFINFWATWCPPCIAEMPAINDLYAKLKNNPNILFLLVNADKDPKKAAEFIKGKKFQMPVAVSQSTIPATWYKGTLPTTVVLDKNGNIVYRHEGTANYSSRQFREFLQGLLK
ncbi:hypothetical protein A8C56_18475 [Niabella ginsenosidivorans]|uniref:Thioredoxin domain-containing protein n=1 Tax=Niabella ginsenosidivorans TaxID=1176587 RepID=A0A1A9I4T8_9BACT|nr:TlpA disulfide reductase family protein [Niabella ginsenosidivorans]ANH82697.1 hypothetical protein A8C56_18475 [Niabella ginsenosidivorans]